MRRLIVLLALFCAGCVGTAPVDEAFLAPDFTAMSLDDEAYTLSGLRGQWVVVNFWATWCAPCVEEMPALQQIADSYAGGLHVLGVNLRESAEVVAPFVERYALRFPILLHPDNDTLLAYQVAGLPQTLVISAAGEIVYRQFGPLDFATFAQTLDSLMRAG